MATGTAGNRPLSSSTAAGASDQSAKRERYIERQLRRTRRQVRGVELASRLMLLAAAAVAFFLAAAVVDHWLVPGGLSIYGRLAFLAVFLVAAGWFTAREIAPLFVYRINPLFAAQTIERAKPTLKNSLLNFLMLRSSRAAVPAVVLNAVEEQAAANLERTSIEHVVDRTRLIHIGYLLLALVAAFCTYYLLSPKSPLQTVGRVVFPWSDLRPASRVELGDIQPGTTTVFLGERVIVSAAVSGLKDDEAVTLYFSTADRQSVDQPLRMYVDKDSYGRHTVTLPPAAEATALSAASGGLQQDIEYRIEAGDAVSRTYRLTVVQAPNIVVDKLDYAYPDYTRLDPETVEKTGDIRAVEGTQVTIHALANQPIASAYVDLGGDGRNKQPMKVASDRASGQRASATIALELNEDRTAPLYGHYVVRFVTDRGHENSEPIRYRIEVTPDPAPELQVLRPDKVEMAVPLNAPVAFEVEANDALYGLADVRIVASVGGESAFRRNKSAGRGDESAARLVFKHLERLDRITLDGGEKLKPGDVIEYWAEAVDNKDPKPNVTKTEVRKLVIAEQERGQNPNEQPQDNDQGDDQANENQQGSDREDRDNQRPNEQQPNEQQPNKQQPNQRGDNNDDKNNDQKNDQAKNNDKNGDKNDGGKNNGDGGDANDAQRDPQNELNRGSAKDQERPSNDRDGQGQKDDQNNAGQSREPGDDQDSAKDDANNDQQADGQKGDSTGQRKSDPRDNQRGGPSEKGAPGEHRTEPGERSNDPQGDAQKNEPRPVDKSDDGEALNRILDHARQKDGKPPEQTDGAKDEQRGAPGEPGSEQQKSDDGKGKSDDAQAKAPPEQNGKGDEQSGKPRDQQSKKQDADKTGAGSPKDDGTKTGQPQPAQDKDSQEGAKPGAAKSDQSKQQDKGAEKRNDKSAEGAQSPQQDRRPKTDESPPPQGGAKNGNDKEQEQPAAGAKGAGDPADKGPDADRQIGDGDSGQKPDDDKTAKDKSDGAGKTKTESGTKKGDGGKSGAAADDQENTDQAKSSNQKQPSDQKRPSDQKQPTGTGGAKDGQPGNEDGQGEARKGGQPRDRTADDDSEKGDSEKNGTEKDGTPKGSPDGKGTATGGGGTPTDDASPPPDQPRVQPSDDKANLEYAKRATDLALDHLRNQLKDDKPDDELLDRLGWTKEDLQKLLTRWEKMEREAKQPGPTGNKAKENLQEALKSLGWKRPGQTTRKASTQADDAAGDLRDTARTAPPPEYADQYRAFKKRTSGREK